jgi:hypothetical protein
MDLTVIPIHLTPLAVQAVIGFSEDLNSNLKAAPSVSLGVGAEYWDMGHQSLALLSEKLMEMASVVHCLSRIMSLSIEKQ